MMIEPDLSLAHQLFDTLRAQSADGVGVTRDTYGAGEQQAHDTLREAALALGLKITIDAALNLYMTMPGRDPALPARMTGSHLDSVPRGGNYDGAAGVVAGIAVLAGWRRHGYQPLADTTVVAIRAEESAWFPTSYIGSKAAFGQLPDAALAGLRRDNRESLGSAIARFGGDLAQLSAGHAHLDPARINRFVELHIEQGPVLIEANEAIGIVTGICGSLRYRNACVKGAYSHSGATPRSHRQDAVLAASELVVAMHRIWGELETAGHELTVTNGCFATDPNQADFSKVAGLVDFCIDMRSRSVATLQEMDRRLHVAIAEIEAAHGVRFALGTQTYTAAAEMDPALRQALLADAQRLGVAHREMPSGAGHDCAMFASMGVPGAMIFVRNAHGSHNPDEAMDLADFAQGARLLSAILHS